MNGREVSISIADLDRELIARGAQSLAGKGFPFRDKEGTPQRTEIFRQVEALYHPANVPPVNPELSHLTTEELLQKIRLMIEDSRLDLKRGIWGIDGRLELFDITDDRVRRNVRSAAAVCEKNDLLDTGDGFCELKIKKYGDTYNLCPCERFYDQPAAACFMCTGVLVAADVVATAAHFVDKYNVKKMCFLFGYMMASPGKAVTRVPAENVYHGVEILDWRYDVRGPNATGTDWTFVRLDRKVEGQEIAKLSKQPVFNDQPLYVIGYPCGLPLKYAPGGMVQRIEKSYFMSELDLFSGNSGSPCFCAETHEMIGIVSRTDCKDFRLVDDCFVTVVYPQDGILSCGSRIIKVSEFDEYFK